VKLHGHGACLIRFAGDHKRGILEPFAIGRHTLSGIASNLRGNEVSRRSVNLGAESLSRTRRFAHFAPVMTILAFVRMITP
jgi:hypothetical protein